MKKSTLYTLICTTIMLPELSLAMETPETPIKKAANEEKQRLREQYPSTPALREKAEREITEDMVSGPRRLRFIEFNVNAEKLERDAEISKREQEIEKKAAEERAAREEKKLKKQLEEKVNQYQNLIEDTKKTIEEQLSSSEAKEKKYEEELADLNKKLSDAEKDLEFTDKMTESLVEKYKQQIAEKTQELNETREEVLQLKFQTRVSPLAAELQAAETHEKNLQSLKDLKGIGTTSTNNPDINPENKNNDTANVVVESTNDSPAPTNNEGKKQSRINVTI